MHEEFLIFPQTESNPLLTCSLAGISYCDGSYSIRRNRQKLFVFEYVEQGRGHLQVESRHYYPQAGDVYIAPGWHEHAYNSDREQPWIKYWINVSGPLVEELLRLYGLEECYWFRQALAAGNHLKNAILARRQNPQADSADFLEPFFFELVRLLAKHHNAETQPHICIDPEMELLQNYLHRHLTEEIPSLRQMADQVHLSISQTIRRFRHSTGMTPAAFLLQKKIRAAADCLRNSRMPIKAIAFQLGFHDEYYFARAFKKYYGIAPGMYRRSFLPDEPDKN